jgi:hypothetical protein
MILFINDLFYIYKYNQEMKEIIINQAQLTKLLETAMDTDIYNQTMDTSVGSPNGDESDAIEDVIERLEELLSMLKTGKKMRTDTRTQIFRNLDQLNQTYNRIKYDK